MLYSVMSLSLSALKAMLRSPGVKWNGSIDITQDLDSTNFPYKASRSTHTNLAATRRHLMGYTKSYIAYDTIITPLHQEMHKHILTSMFGDTAL